MPSSWDICVLSMSEALYDARTLNVARSFAQEGWRTCLLSWGTPEAATFLQRLGIEGILRPRPALRRVWKQWLLFSLWVLRNRHSLQARVYWAADIYTLPFAAHLARRRQAIVFYDSRELFFALASLRKRPLAQRFLQWAESRYIHAACRCIVSGWLDADALQRRYRLRQPPLVLLNVPPYRVPLRGDRLRRTLHLPTESIVLLYQGAVLEGRGLERAIRLLCQLPEAVLCILGDGVYRPQLEQMAQRFNVAHRLHWLGWRPYSELLEWTASADIGLCLIEPISHSYELALPNKVFEYCMAGIPTIATALPALRTLFERYRIGVLVPPDFSPDELGRAVRTLRIPEVWQQYHKRCREAATRLCWEVQHSKLAELLATPSC
ncbi:MAG: glycosyltransferase [Candidatus Kapabacteria bacterium]|nr:glycosyltransferase [Candidatus Kapabacteria bacterium]